MDMYQKRKMRQEKKNNGGQESFSKVPISWYIPTLINFPRKPYFTRVYI